MIIILTVSNKSNPEPFQLGHLINSKSYKDTQIPYAG